MAKQLTKWRRKGNTPATGAYNASTVDYDSATQTYAGNGLSPRSVIKKVTAWGKRAKQLTHFVVNPASYANAQPYDTNRAYDVAATYDSIVIGEPRSTRKKPTEWSKA